MRRRHPHLPWLGHIPSGWSVERGRFLYAQESRPPSDDVGVVTAFRDGQVTLRENRRTDGFTFAIKETGYQGVKHGDLVIHTMDAFAGAIGVSESDGKCTGEYAVCNPSREGIDNRYYAHLLREMARQGYIFVICPSVRERAPRFRYARFKDVYFPVPLGSTQKAIATYLDRKTAAIDALIEKKVKLIALMAEKRATLINRAMTKGLNPDVPMKDSGVPTLGRIPSHWEVLRNKALVREVVELSATGEEELLSVSHLSGVTKRSEKDVTMFMAETNEGYKKVREGDLVINTMWAWMGALGTATEAGIVSPAYGVYRLDQRRMIPRFYDFFYRTPQYITEMTRFSKGVWSSRLRLYPESFLALRVAVPPVAEQRAVLDYIDGEVGRFPELERGLVASVERLREYRQALITAAVTGQIDVSSEVTS